MIEVVIERSNLSSANGLRSFIEMFCLHCLLFLLIYNFLSYWLDAIVLSLFLCLSVSLWISLSIGDLLLDYGGESM